MSEAIRDLIADDTHAATFKSTAQYRTALLQFIDTMTTAVYGQMLETIRRMAAARIDCSITTDGRTVFVNCDSAQKPVATVRVTSKGYAMTLSTHVAYALPEGMHDLYAAPPSASPAALTDAVAALTRLEQQGWLRHIERQADSVRGSEVEADIRETVAMARAALLAASPADQVTSAARDVLAERRRQVEAEGWTPEHDDEHANGEMAMAAATYAAAGSLQGADRSVITTFGAEGTPYWIKEMWPWAREWWKPGTQRRDLVKAGALILAELERIDRAAMSASKEGA